MAMTGARLLQTRESQLACYRQEVIRAEVSRPHGTVGGAAVSM
jgi:hypothetical protein